MKEYMTNLGSVLMLTALSDMLVPEGGLKKYVSLAMGFILITAALSVIPGDFDGLFFNDASFRLSDGEIARAEAENRAEVLQLHRENIRRLIEQRMKHGSKAYPEVSDKGEITRITLRLRGDESEAIFYIVETLKVPRERILTEYDKN